MADEGLRRALDALSTRLHAEVDRQVHAAFDELAASMPAPQEPAPPAPTGPSDSGAGERLVGAIQAIGQARSLTDMLEALVTRIGDEAHRVGVFLVRGDRLVSWRLAGFDGAAAEGTVEVGLDEAGILAAAVRGNTTITDETGDDVPSFAKPAAEGVAVPIALSGEVVAVLYADHGVTGSWRGTVEILARYGARCLEVLTAFKVARSMAHPQQAEASAAEHDGGPGGDVGDVDEAADIAARRYARLLVSEIKLYHEAEVVSGRQARDLATRLGGEIARARSQYEQRVPLPVRQRADFFHDELVRTLAAGDASVLETDK
jgi:hypothetical protein